MKGRWRSHERNQEHLHRHRMATWEEAFEGLLCGSTQGPLQPGWTVSVVLQNPRSRWRSTVFSGPWQPDWPAYSPSLSVGCHRYPISCPTGHQSTCDPKQWTRKVQKAWMEMRTPGRETMLNSAGTTSTVEGIVALTRRIRAADGKIVTTMTVSLSSETRPISVASTTARH
ncbi:hypothetical protein VTN77DRAFT_6847 [Rasamsonia byssochlamydoides]|uniref:uncharacterized protein n=1 Tax=Rasamsonia byssochlamydoides TaxID=89139 RepID=UPI003742932D